MIIGGFHLDPVESISAIKRIKMMAREYDAEIFPSHDMDALADLEARTRFLRLTSRTTRRRP